MNKETELQNIYRNRFAGKISYRDKVWLLLCKHVFSKYVLEDTTVLDLGCGDGGFINNICAKTKWGLDLNPDCSKHLDLDVHFLQQDCSETWGVAAGSIDVVFTSNFFEHLNSKQLLGKILDETHRVLKTGGKLIAMGPNINILPGKYWDFWDHYIPLSEKSLSEALVNRGFRVDECIARFLPYTMVGKKEVPEVMIWLYLKVRFIWPVFGKQFLVVATKI